VRLPNTTKLWSNVAYAAATVCFVKANWAAIAPGDIWAVYLAVVGLHATADTLIQLRYGPRKDDPA